MKLASGILPLADNTKQICLAWRAPQIPEGNCWGVIGGMLKEGKSFKENALIELEEEMGYSGPIELRHAFKYRVPGFTYQNFLGIVPEPFTMAPTDPEFAMETSFIEWVSYDKLYEMVDNQSYQFHKGLLSLLYENQKEIWELIHDQ